MTEMSARVDALLADPLAPARRRAQSGERVIGYIGLDVPVELIRAADACAIELPARVEAQTPRADRYLESSFAPALRSIAEQWLSGAYDFLDTVVLSRSDDGTQRLYYYICELQRRGLAAGPCVLLYDIAKIPRTRSDEHTLAATMRLAGELGTEAQALPDAIAVRNRRRELLLELSRRREKEAPPPGTAVERLLRSSELDDPEAFDEALSQWMRVPLAPRGGPRLLLAGSPPPDERLHAAVERAGGCVVDECGDHTARRLGEPIRAEAVDSRRHPQNAFESLSRHYQRLPYGPRAFCDRAAAIGERARSARVDGVVLWLIEEDETLAWSAPAMQRALTARGIPHLTLARRRWDAGDGALEAVSEFVANLEVRS